MNDIKNSWAEEHEVFVPIKAYSHKELLDMYGVSAYIFQGWFKPYIETIGAPTGKMYTIRQIEMIFTELGRPRVKIRYNKAA